MRLVIDPLALVLVAMNMPESSRTMSFVETPITLIASTVRPDLNTAPIAIWSLPLTSVPGAVLKRELRSILNKCVIRLTFFKFHADCRARCHAL